MPRTTNDHAAELLRQVRRLVDARDERRFKDLADDSVKLAARPVERLLPKNRKKVGTVIKDCRRALHSVESVWGHEALTTRKVRNELTNFIRLCEQVMRGMPATRRSGGDPNLSIRKRLTAELAVELILNCGDRMPTVDLVSEVAAKLFELATGEEPSNMDEYASALFRRMQEGGFPDARARRRLDRDGERAACDKLRENLRIYCCLWPGPGRRIVF